VTKLSPTGALVYSTFLSGSGTIQGGSGAEGDGIAVDSAGNAYVTGLTRSINFPTMNPFQPTYGGGDSDAFVTKLNPNGSALVYSTYLGGTKQDDGGTIAVDSLGNAYVTGFTDSKDFPTMNPLQSALGGFYGNAFVTKLNPSGSALVYSTYLGGSSGQNGGYDGGSGVALDSAGSAYITGWTYSTNFPVTPGAFQTKYNRGGRDAFVARLNPSGSALVYSTYLGGSGDDVGLGVADSAGDAYVVGWTYSSDFPTMNPLQPANGGGSDAFVAKIDMKPVPTITLLSSLNPSIYGQVVTFTAMLTSGLGAPPDGEAVTFMKGTKVLGTGTLSGGSASFTTSTLPAGTYSIKAVYSGDANFTASTSKVLKQVVNKATTTTALASSLNPSNFGQSVTFTANVTPQFSGTVKGSVTFYDGATALKTVALSGGVAKFTTSTLTSGSHSITATYNGSASFIGSSASLTQTVN
jgi:Bacterial Ig-like domain (group 3)/Beta-propeller repeat